jgi:hypothetical protein
MSSSLTPGSIKGNISDDRPLGSTNKSSQDQVGNLDIYEAIMSTSNNLENRIVTLEAQLDRETAEEEVATSMTWCTRGGEIRRVGVGVEYHVQGAVTYDGIGVRPHVVKELLDLFLGAFGWRRLLSGDVG